MQYSVKIAMKLAGSILLLGSFSTQAEPIQPTLKFYEGKYATQDLVCSIVAKNETINFKKDTYNCENDEASSLVLSQIPFGTVITIYDDPNSSTNDDYTVITVEEDIVENYTVGDFEMNDFNGNVSVEYFRKNGLKGKVSSVKIQMPEDTAEE
ncbi:hypothetical protein V9N52_004196 [Vibrio navarrensis]